MLLYIVSGNDVADVGSPQPLRGGGLLSLFACLSARLRD